MIMATDGMSSSSLLESVSGRLSSSSNPEQDSPVDSPTGSMTSYNQGFSGNIAQGTKVRASTEMSYSFDGEESSDGNVSGEPPPDYKYGASKRDIHTINEQRRRDMIKQGYAQLIDLVPTCRPSTSGVKPSRAVILQRSIDYIKYLQNQSIKQKEQEAELEKEVHALKIMKENYEQIVRAHQTTTKSSGAPQVPDQVKFLVFKGIFDQLFESFNSSISVTSFDTLSSCVISWLEEYCKPQILRETVMSNLRQVDTVSPFTLPPQVTPNSATHGQQKHHSSSRTPT